MHSSPTHGSPMHRREVLRLLGLTCALPRQRIGYDVTIHCAAAGAGDGALS